jgi:hypothetical protein
MQTDRVPQAKHSLLASGLHEARVTPLICTLACLRTRAKQMKASSEWPPDGMRPTSLMVSADDVASDGRFLLVACLCYFPCFSCWISCSSRSLVFLSACISSSSAG